MAHPKTPAPTTTTSASWYLFRRSWRASGPEPALAVVADMVYVYVYVSVEREGGWWRGAWEEG